MVVFRRWLLLWLLMFWLGGFTFYAAVVVPIGTEVLESAREQGRITREVTVWLNVAGAVALAVWAWYLAAAPASTRPVNLLHWLLWTVLVVALAALACLHVRLDELFDAERGRILDRGTFRSLHRVYLWVSTVQWGTAILLTAAMLRTWRQRDRRERRAEGLVLNDNRNVRS